jgi:ATP-dependent Clp protease ATP-binding subunit ClpB
MVEEVIEKTKHQVFDILKQTVRPEFLNRIDETIMFRPLTKKDIEGIIKIQIESLQERLHKNDIKIDITKEGITALAELGYDPQFGARPVKRVIQKKILNQLSKEILAGRVNSDDAILIDAFDHNFVFRKNQANKEKRQVVESD